MSRKNIWELGMYEQEAVQSPQIPMVGFGDRRWSWWGSLLVPYPLITLSNTRLSSATLNVLVPVVFLVITRTRCANRGWNPVGAANGSTFVTTMAETRTKDNIETNICAFKVHPSVNVHDNTCTSHG